MTGEQRAAIERLAETAPAGRERAFSEARTHAADADREVRAAACAAVAATGTPSEAIATLGKLASDADVGVRLGAAIALANTPWRGRFPLLWKLLTDPDKGVVAVAADALAHAGDKRATSTLHELLRERRLRFEALEGLFALDEPSLEPIANKTFGAFFSPPFEKAVAALYLAAHGDAKALEYVRTRAQKRRAEERPLLVIHLARIDPSEGRRLVEKLAETPDEYLRESALLALAKLDPAAWWARAQEAVGRYADTDPHVSAEMLLGLFDADWTRASLVADAHVARESELGVAARRVRLGALLRAEHPAEVQLRCA